MIHVDGNGLIKIDKDAFPSLLKLLSEVCRKRLYYLRKSDFMTSFWAIFVEPICTLIN